MRILILGAGGFIGSHLVQHLIGREEHEVLGVDISNEKLEGIAGRNFRFLEADVDEIPERLIKQADVVVDLVAHANPSLYVTEPIRVFELNFESNLAIARLCAKHGAHLIQYSTAEVYGKPAPGATAFREDDSDLILGPVNRQRWIYSASKQLLERVIHAYGLRDELSYTIIRPFNFVGSRFDYLVAPGSRGGPRVFAHFLSALLADGPLYLVNGGEQRRAFLAIEDANHAFQAILDDPIATHNEIFNVGNPRNDISIRELAELMIELAADLTGRAPASAVVPISGEEFYGRGYDDSTRVPPDISKIAALGWQPTLGLRETFERAMRPYLAGSRGRAGAGDRLEAPAGARS